MIPESKQELIERILNFADKCSDNGRPLYGYQRNIARRIIQSAIDRDAEELTALCARQSGKTEATSRVVAALAICLPVIYQAIPSFDHYQQGFWVGIFAPIKDQASIMYKRIKAFFDCENGKEILSEFGITSDTSNGNELKLSNGSYILCLSASPSSHIEARTLHLAIEDEAQDISPYVSLKSIMPMLTAVRGFSVKEGTPTGKRSSFFDAIQRNKRLNNGCHFEYNADVAGAENPDYAFTLQKAKEKIGEDSDAFRMSYKLEWIFERGMFLSPEKIGAIETACKEFPLINELRDQFCYAGIDWGKRNDSTVVTIGTDDKGKARIINWLELQGDDYADQLEYIEEFLKGYSIRILVAESVGSGDPMVDLLKKRFRNARIRIEGFDTTARSKHDLFSAFARSISEDKWLFPSNPEARRDPRYQKFLQQFMDLEKSYRGNLMVVSHPDSDENDMHDDFCFSAAFMHHAWALATTKSMKPTARTFDNPVNFRRVYT